MRARISVLLFAAAVAWASLATASAQDCCLNGDCCHGVEYCCDTCNGNCRCSVGGSCSPLAVSRTVVAAAATPRAATDALFDTFAARFGKSYSSASDEQAARAVFAENVRRAAQMSAADPHAAFSPLTPHADLTREEYSRMHGLARPDRTGVGVDPGLPCQFTGKGVVPTLTPTAAPLKSLDYVARGATAPIKNQGKCGSCWAHASTAVAEARMKLDTGNITALSVQYLLDCDGARLCKGCCGGLPERALQWLAGDSGGLPGEGQGIASEAAYPYVSGSGKDPTAGHCNHAAPLVAKLKGFGVLQGSPKTPVSIASLLGAATEYGVLATTIDAHALQFYQSGIITNSTSCADSDHAVAIVGYGNEGGVDFLKVRNSYGTQFGEGGYFRIGFQAAQDCGLLSCVIAGTSGPQ